METADNNEKLFLNVGCGTHYALGWVNTDTWVNETTMPDVQVVPGEPYPFPDNHFDAVYMGHVLEHIPWKEVPEFLMDISRIAKPNAPILIVGPDVYKTIVRWAQGQEPWWMIESVIEHQDVNHQPGREMDWWDGAHHHWNCHHDRVQILLESLGFRQSSNVFDLIPKNPEGKNWIHDGINWPVVGFWHWQFAIYCQNKNKVIV